MLHEYRLAHIALAAWLVITCTRVSFLRPRQAAKEEGISAVPFVAHTVPAQATYFTGCLEASVEVLTLRGLSSRASGSWCRSLKSLVAS